MKFRISRELAKGREVRCETTNRFRFDRTSFIGEDLIVTEVEPSQVGER